MPSGCNPSGSNNIFLYIPPLVLIRIQNHFKQKINKCVSLKHICQTSFVYLHQSFLVAYFYLKYLTVIGCRNYFGYFRIPFIFIFLHLNLFIVSTNYHYNSLYQWWCKQNCVSLPSSCFLVLLLFLLLYLLLLLVPLLFPMATSHHWSTSKIKIIFGQTSGNIPGWNIKTNNSNNNLATLLIRIRMIILVLLSLIIFKQIIRKQFMNFCLLIFLLNI